MNKNLTMVVGVNCHASVYIMAVSMMCTYVRSRLLYSCLGNSDVVFKSVCLQCTCKCCNYREIHDLHCVYLMKPFGNDAIIYNIII